MKSLYQLFFESSSINPKELKKIMPYMEKVLGSGMKFLDKYDFSYDPKDTVYMSQKELQSVGDRGVEYDYGFQLFTKKKTFYEIQAEGINLPKSIKDDVSDEIEFVMQEAFDNIYISLPSDITDKYEIYSGEDLKSAYYNNSLPPEIVKDIESYLDSTLTSSFIDAFIRVYGNESGSIIECGFEYWENDGIRLANDFLDAYNYKKSKITLDDLIDSETKAIFKALEREVIMTVSKSFI